MKRVVRYDRGSLRKSHRTDEGYLYAEGYAVRAGILTYRRADGSTVRELIPEEELAKADSLATLGNKPVTLEHPNESVTAENQDRYQVGTVGSEIEVAGGFVKIKLAVHNDAAVKAVDDGKVELSPGYTVEIDPTPGTHPEHGRYDAIQRNRRYNHLAIVSRARGGSEVRLRSDDAYQIVQDADVPDASSAAPAASEPAQESQMNPKLVQLLAVLGVTNLDSEDAAIEAGATAAAKYKADAESAESARTDGVELKTKLDAAEVELVTTKEAVSTLEGERDVLQASVTALQTKVDAAEAAAKAKADAEAVEALNPLCAWLKVDTADKDLASLRRDAAAAYFGDLREDADDSYIGAVLDGAKKAFAAREDGVDHWAGFTPARTDGADNDAANRSDNAEDNAPARLGQIALSGGKK